MSPRKSVSLGSFPIPRIAAVRPPKARAARRRKGNSETEMTKSELEEMVLQAARMRAIKAHTCT
jgi:hypothetical protein